MPESDDPVLNTKTLVAGKGRTKHVPGGGFHNGKMDEKGRPLWEPNEPVKLTDLELEDDPVARRVYVVCPGQPRRWAPYEWILTAEEEPTEVEAAQFAAVAVPPARGKKHGSVK